MTHQGQAPHDAGPADLSQFAMAAVMSHEMFVSYLKAGFTEQQALYLLAQLILGGQSRPE